MGNFDFIIIKAKEEQSLLKKRTWTVSFKKKKGNGGFRIGRSVGRDGAYIGQGILNNMSLSKIELGKEAALK